MAAIAQMVKDFSKETAIVGISGAGVTWLASRLVSSATKPLVGSVITTTAHLVSSVAGETLFKIFKFSDTVCMFTFLACELVLPIFFGMGAAAMGYPISLPLTLVLGVSNIVNQAMISAWFD